MLFHLGVLNKDNTGDMACNPALYFDFGQELIDLDIREDLQFSFSKNDVVIIGGGGLLNYHSDWNRRINDVLSSGCKTIFWGAGENSHYDDTTNKPNIVFPKQCLVGLRDAYSEFFLPCVSCMSKHFDKLERGSSANKLVGAVYHLESDLGRFCKDNGYLYIENKTSFFDVLQHISTHDVILTNTYHGAYWSELMGKKVVIVRPFSTRFNGLPIRHQILNDLNTTAIESAVKKEILNVGTSVDMNLLKRCRELNEVFFRKVKKFIAGVEFL